MYEDRIIQIIPAPTDMWAVHRGKDNGEDYECWSRVVCLALMEDSRTGCRYVRPMEMAERDIDIDFADEMGASDICGIAYATVEEAQRRGMAYDLARKEDTNHD